VANVEQLTTNPQPRGTGDTISAVRSALVAIPLPRPVAWSNVKVSHRENVLVWVETKSGGEGFGFAMGSRFQGGGRVIKAAVDEVLVPVLVGEDPGDIR
jgi:D-arabinonate dehydratase